MSIELRMLAGYGKLYNFIAGTNPRILEIKVLTHFAYVKFASNYSFSYFNNKKTIEVRRYRSTNRLRKNPTSSLPILIPKYLGSKFWIQILYTLILIGSCMYK